MAYVDLDTIHRPSSGAIAPTAWGDQINDNFTALYGSLTEAVALEVPHTWNWTGDVLVPSGATGYVGPMFVPVPEGQTATLAGVVVFARSGTVTLSMEHNGSVITGLSGLSATSTASGRIAPTDGVSFADCDTLVPVVTAISETPDGLTVTAFVIYATEVTA